MKQTLLISFLVFFFSFAFCQDSYVTLDGNKVDGTIEGYREWSKNPASVIFKEASGTTVTLTSQNCKSFTAGSDAYVSYHGTRVSNSDNVVYSQGAMDEQEMKDTVSVFLRRVYQYQNYALYKLFDDKRINFYLAKDGNLKELEYYETIKDNVADPFNIYKSTLYKEFSGKNVRNFQHKLSLLTYKENSLISFLADVCSDQEHVTESSRNKYPTETLLGVGINENSGKVTDLYNRFSYSQSSIAPSFEIGLRLYNQRNFGKLFFQPTLTLMMLKNSFNGGNINVKGTLADVNLGVGYMFLKKEKVSIYAAVAGALPIIFNFETQRGNGKYFGSPGPDDRISVHSELGVVINHTLNISVANLFPIKFPFNGDGVVDGILAYQLSQTSVAIRYAFIHRGNKK